MIGFRPAPGRISRCIGRCIIAGAISAAPALAQGPARRALVASGDSVATAIADVNLGARRAELLAADSAYGRVRTRGIAGRLTEPLADSALVIGPGTMLWRSADATRSWLLADTANMQAQVNWAPIEGDVSADGTEGFTFGFLDLVGGGSPRRTWKYLAYWRRDETGAWKMVAHKRLPRPEGPHEDIAPLRFQTTTRRIGTWFPAGAGELAALMAVDSTFARTAQQGAEQAFRAYTARNGVTFGGEAGFAWGQEAVATSFSSFAPGTIDWAPDVGGLAPGGDLGFAIGVVVIRERSADGGLRETARARYFTVWQRDPDGRWKLIVDG